MTPEIRAKISASLKGRKQDPEVVVRRAQAIRESAARKKKLWSEQECDDVLSLHDDGMANVQIAEILGLDRKAVGTFLISKGRRSHYVRTKIVDLGGGMVRCTKCDRTLPREELPWGRVTKDPYQLSYCKPCHARQNLMNSSKNMAQYLRHRQRSIKSRATEKGYPFDLPEGHLIDLYDRQRGLCFYTDDPMMVYYGTGRPGSRRDSLSVDKIVPENGYVEGNVVLCISRANFVKLDCTLDEMANWMPGWHERIQVFWKSLGLKVAVVPGWDEQALGGDPVKVEI